MSESVTPSGTSGNAGGDTLAAAPPSLRPWRALLAIGLSLLVWPVVGWTLHREHSALLAFGAYHLLCLGGGWLLREAAPASTEKKFPIRWATLIGATLAANLITYVLYRYIGAVFFDKKHVLDTLGQWGLTPASYRFLFPYFAFVNPVLEEFFWRAGVYTTLRQRVRLWHLAAAVSSLLFGAWHFLVLILFLPLPLALVSVLIVSGAGLVLTVVYERTRRLTYPVALHAFAADVPCLLLLILLGR